MRRKAREIESPWQHDATAGLAQVALAEGDVATALREAEAVLAHVAEALDAGWKREASLDRDDLPSGACPSARPARDRVAGQCPRRAGAQAATIPTLRCARASSRTSAHRREIAAAWAFNPDGSAMSSPMARTARPVAARRSPAITAVAVFDTSERW